MTDVGERTVCISSGRQTQPTWEHIRTTLCQPMISLYIYIHIYNCVLVLSEPNKCVCVCCHLYTAQVWLYRSASFLSRHWHNNLNQVHCTQNTPRLVGVGSVPFDGRDDRTEAASSVKRWRWVNWRSREEFMTWKPGRYIS